MSVSANEEFRVISPPPPPQSPKKVRGTHPHGSMKSPRNLIVLLQPRTAPQDLGQPKLPNGALHVSNLALGGRGSLDPLRGLSAHAADHVGMREGLWGALLGLDVEGGGNWLGDARVQRGGPAGDDEVGVGLVAGGRTAFTIAGPGTDEGGVVVERRAHVEE